MPQIGHIKVAIATNDLLQANGHFASAKQLVIYDVSVQAFEFVDCVQFRRQAGGQDAVAKGPGGGLGCSMADPSGGVSSELMQERVAAVEGCAMLFCRGLSEVQAVNMQNLAVFPVKLERSREISEVIAKVQALIARPPVWLRRALGVAVPVEAAPAI